MSQRTGMAMMIAGGLIALGGVLWLVIGDFDDDPIEMPATAAPTTVTATTAAPITTTTAPTATTAPPPTTSTVPSTTTTAPPTTTTVLQETVDEFLVLFRQALDGNDLDFLFERLHPIVRDEFGADLCRDFIEREIAALDNYEPVADVPESRPQSILGTTVDLYEVPIEFDFQGQHFEAVGTFAVVAGRVHYLAECR